MKIYKMKNESLKPFFESMTSLGVIWGPTKKKDHHVFTELDSFESFDYEYTRTLLPIKKIFFKQKEELFQFNYGSSDREFISTVVETKIEERTKIVMGLKPCEIHALNIQDEFFLNGDFTDPYYAEHRNNTIIIGFSCIPDDHCLCNNTDTGDVSFGFDLFFNDIGDKYIVWVGSNVGDELVLQNFDLFDEQITEEDRRDFNDWTRGRKLLFQHNYEQTFHTLSKLMELNYDASFWDDLGDKCLSCGACTMVCPTCSCFNVMDNMSASERAGFRERYWDSCHYPKFSVVAGDIDFRKTRASRLKLYYTHKFNAYNVEDGPPSCVGCGRCVDACPVDINALSVLKLLRDE